MEKKYLKRILISGLIICSLTGVATSAALIFNNANRTIEGSADSVLSLNYGDTYSISCESFSPVSPIYSLVSVNFKTSSFEGMLSANPILTYTMDLKDNGVDVTGIKYTVSTTDWSFSDATIYEQNSISLNPYKFNDKKNAVTYYVKVEISEAGYNAITSNVVTGSLNIHYDLGASI